MNSEGLYFGDQFVVCPAQARRIHEHPIAFVSNLGRAANRGDLGFHLAHQQTVDDRGLVAEVESFGSTSDPAREKTLRRGTDPMIAQPVQCMVNLGDEIGRVDHVDARTIQFGAVDLERAVEIESDMPITANQRQRLSFEDTEISGVA